MADKGLIHVYTGDGKGKTTAVIGLATRARGAGKRVGFVQFMKGRESSEIKPLQTLGVNVVRMGTITKFVPHMTDEERAQSAKEQGAGLDAAVAMAGDLDVLILDEIISAITTGMVPEDKVVSFLRDKPAGLEVALTGRNVPDAIRDMADYLSDIKAVKHPYEQGIPARRGIEM